MRCINHTCGRPLTRLEIRRRETRCATCTGAGGQLKPPHPFNASLFPTKPPPSLTSWWTAAPAERFTALAQAHLVPTVAGGLKRG